MKYFVPNLIRDYFSPSTAVDKTTGTHLLRKRVKHKQQNQMTYQNTQAVTVPQNHKLIFF